jgi:hypothetical protein
MESLKTLFNANFGKNVEVQKNDFKTTFSGFFGEPWSREPLV